MVAITGSASAQAWSLGLEAVSEQRLTTQREVSLVGARGCEPAVPTPRIVLPRAIADALAAAV